MLVGAAYGRGATTTLRLPSGIFSVLTTANSGLPMESKSALRSAFAGRPVSCPSGARIVIPHGCAPSNWALVIFGTAERGITKGYSGSTGQPASRKNFAIQAANEAQSTPSIEYKTSIFAGVL